MVYAASIRANLDPL